MLHDLTGQVIERLTVVAFHHRISTGPGRGTYWSCDCSCGTKGYITTSKSLVTAMKGKRGGAKSCGCLLLEQATKNCIKRSRTHGETHTPKGGTRQETPEYRCWKTIKTRCYNPNYKQYKDYGARGIKVCDRWLDNFSNFLADMGRKPSLAHSIERRRVNEDYSPDNCYWGTDKEQRRNRRTTKWITLNGQTKALVDWLEELGIKKTVYDYRVYEYGESPEDALLMGPGKSQRERHR